MASGDSENRLPNMAASIDGPYAVQVMAVPQRGRYPFSSSWIPSRMSTAGQKPRLPAASTHGAAAPPFDTQVHAVQGGGAAEVLRQSGDFDDRCGGSHGTVLTGIRRGLRNWGCRRAGGGPFGRHFNVQVISADDQPRCTCPGLTMRCPGSMAL